MNRTYFSLLLLATIASTGTQAQSISGAGRHLQMVDNKTEQMVQASFPTSEICLHFKSALDNALNNQVLGRISCSTVSAAEKLRYTAIAKNLEADFLYELNGRTLSDCTGLVELFTSNKSTNSVISECQLK